MAHTAVLLLFLAVTYDQILDPREVSSAIAIGQSTVDAGRARFHQPYRVLVNRPPVDSIEFVTPFRRVVLAAEAQARIGNRIFTQREGLAIATGGGGRVDVIVETTFHPLNTYVAVPAYDVVLVASGTSSAVLPSLVDRVPRFGLGAPGRQRPGSGEPLIGGTVTASFNGDALNASGIYDVVISEAGKELARVRLDVGSIR